MDLMRSPERADRLAAAYALGTLRGRARRRFEALARQSPTLRAGAIVWQERLAAMTELQPEEPPSPNVWRRIAIALRNEAQPAPPRPAPRLGFWRGAALSGAFASLVAFMLAGYLGTQLTQMSASPEIRYVAMLEDDRSAPAMLVTFDARHGTLTIKRMGSFQEGPDRSLQLWALPAGGGPRSLGVLATGASMKLTAVEGQVREMPALAISLEPKGGAPAGSGPTGPVLFKGPLMPTT
jgi:anti-sigma-K factor RskA